MAIPGIGNGSNYGAYGDDFMASQYFKQLYGQNNTQGGAQTTATGNTNPSFQGGMYQQPPADTFQKQDSNIGTGLLYGGIAGAATGAGMYYKGTNPIGEKELAKGFSKEFGKEYTNILRQDALDNALKTKNIKPEVLENIKSYIQSGDATKLSKDAETALGAGFTKDTAEKYVKSINDDIAKIVDPADIHLQNQKLAKLQQIQANFNGLPNKKAATLEKFFTENADHFGLKGADEAATKTNVQNYIKNNKVKAIRANIAGQIKTQEGAVKNASTVLDDVFKLWNKDKKAFNTGSTDAITKACEKGLANFKWKKAGKWAAIAAGVAAIGTWMFGGSKSAQKTA